MSKGPVKLTPLAVLVALLGCSLGGSDGSGSEAASTRPTPSVSTTPEPGRDALIYASVIRQLVTKDHPYGGFKVIFVVDGVVPHANRPTQPSDPEEPFGHDLKDGMRFLSALADLPPLEFIAERDSVLMGAGSQDPGRVRKGGVLISLGPIEGAANRVEVGNNLWLAGKGSRWQTYVLEQRSGVLKVTGTTGPTAIS